MMFKKKFEKKKNKFNLTIITIVLFLSLILFSKTSYSSSVCCTDNTSSLFCTNITEEDYNNNLNSICNKINSSSDFNKGCFNIPSENYIGASECNPPNNVGYCCGIGQSDRFYTEEDCNFLSGSFIQYSGQSYQDACTQNTQGCDVNDLSFTVEPVKGDNKFKISWNVCEGGKTSLTKKIQNTEIKLLDKEEVTNSYIDSVDWGRKTYTYNIRVEYDNGSVKTDEITITSGDEICEGKKDNDPFCTDNYTTLEGIEESNVGGYCDSDNQYHFEKSCGEQKCKIGLDENNVKEIICAYSDSCEDKNINFFNSSLNRKYCETVQVGEKKGDPAYCFYDNKSYSIQSYCYSCSNNCFSYKSKSSCEEDACGIGSCAWKPILGSVNGGVCIDVEKNNCELLTDLEQNSGVSKTAFSEILQPVLKSGDYSYKKVFSNQNYICDSLKGNCYEILSCLDYNKEECNSNICFEGVSCGWNTNINKCVRLNEKRKSVCNGIEECEKDWFPPKSKVEFDSKNNNFKITLLEDKNERFEYYSPVSIGEVEFYACVVLDGKTECNDKTDFKKIDSRIFSLKNLISEDDFNSIKKKNSILKYYSKDKHENYESIKRLNFIPKSYDGSFEKIVLVKPKYSAVIKGETTSFVLKLNFDNSSVCKYSFTKNNFTPSNAEYNKILEEPYNNIVYSEEETVSEDSYLYVYCKDENNKNIYSKFLIKAMGINPPIIKEVYASPKVLFIQNSKGNYETKITVESNKKVFCKYSLEEKQPEEYSFGSMNYFFGYDDNFDYKDFSEKKDYTLIIPNNFLKQEFNVTVICEDQIETKSSIKKTKIKITNTPSFDDWVRIESPKKEYYKNTTVLFNLSVFIKNSECNILIDNTNFFSLEKEQNTFYKNIDLSQGEHEIKYICEYTYQTIEGEKKHRNTKKTILYVDSIKPQVNFTIMGDYYDSGRPIIYSKILKLDSNITDKETGIASIIYILYNEDKTRIIQKGVYEEGEEIKTKGLENGKVYVLKIVASDIAGNVNFKEESFKTDFSVYCSNNIFDSEYETDVDCGGSCPSCGIGKVCNTSLDCNEGLVCDETYNKCYANTCYDNIKNGDETGVDCGGSCVECKKEFKLIYPKFGISSKEEFNVLINTSKKLLCNYKFENEEYKTLDDKIKNEHYIYNVKIKDGDKKRLYLNCTDGEKYYSEIFVLKVDVKKPRILSYEINPYVTNIKTNKNGIISYWNELNVITDKRTVCKFNINESGDYESFKGVFDKGNENKSQDYILNHNLWLPLEEGEHEIYVSCKSLNSLTTPIHLRQAYDVADKKAKLIILSPLFRKVYSSNVLAFIDATVKNNYCKYKFDSFDYKSLNKSTENIYSSEFKIITSGSHKFIAVCNYDNYSSSGEKIGTYNVTREVPFYTDIENPKIKSVVLKDPYTDSEKILEDNSIKIVLDYEEENPYSFIISVFVNEEKLLEKTFFGKHKEFFINNLNLSNDTKIKVKVKLLDSQGNFAEKESNYLDVVLNDKDKKLLGENCTFDYECKEGVCSDNICISEEEICSNDYFDSYYETGKDCGGLCSLKYNKSCTEGKECISSLDCESGYTCTNNVCVLDIISMCNNNKKDLYESDVDCGDLCEFYLDKSCSIKQMCNSNADCKSNKCERGYCVENNIKILPEYCLKEEFNNTIIKDNETFFCGGECEYKCTEGTGCRNSFDCEVGLTCINNTCVRKEVEEKTLCEPTDFTSNCGGTCEKCGLGGVCESDSDCKAGYECNYNKEKENKICEKKTIKIENFCRDDSECDRGEYCDLELNSCIKKKNNFWLYILIFLFLIIFSLSIYMVYLYYYKPEEYYKLESKMKTFFSTKNFKEKKSVKKEEYNMNKKGKSKKSFLEDKKIGKIERGENLKTSNLNFDINSPKNKPIIEKEKQKRIKELIRKKRLEEKKKEREELLKKLEESKLDQKSKSKNKK